MASRICSFVSRASPTCCCRSNVFFSCPPVSRRHAVVVPKAFCMPVCISPTYVYMLCVRLNKCMYVRSISLCDCLVSPGEVKSYRSVGIRCKGRVGSFFVLIPQRSLLYCGQGCGLVNKNAYARARRVVALPCLVSPCVVSLPVLTVPEGNCMRGEFIQTMY